MVDYAHYQLDLPLDTASRLALVHGLFQAVGVLTVLPLSDYAGRKRTILASKIVITALLTGLLFIGESLIMLYGITAAMALFYGATFPIYGACAGDYFPREALGTVTGAWTPF
jgi:MFS family permease